ncbi:MAG: hypothetical protein U0599_13855 [Vicinamibacteria bacterium]
MTENPDLDEFERQVDELKRHPLLRAHIKRGEVHFQELPLAEVDQLVRSGDAAYYFLMAAAELTRTTLKKATKDPEAGIVAVRQRKAFALKKRLPTRQQFDKVAHTAVALRAGDLGRRNRGFAEQLFRDRLKAESIPILMSPPVRQVPGLLIGKRKPDGVYPDPLSGQPPIVYLEIKNVRRVADDIQKRLYEIAEASLEMKFLYGNLSLQGLGITDTRQVVDALPQLRASLRAQITATPPVIVVLMLCPAAEAERYRQPAEAFVDRVFFQEEIEECLAFLKKLITDRL